MAAAGGARLADTASSLQLAAAVRRAAGCAVCAGATTPRRQPAMPRMVLRGYYSRRAGTNAMSTS
eukprot:COSAG03_NODE_202_length_10693_cov_87.311497_3_plen_65_part_00